MIRAQVASSVAALLLVGCGGGEGSVSTGPTPCPLPPPGGNEQLLPKGLELTEYGVLAEAGVSRGFVTARVVSDIQIVELYPPIARALVDNGFKILSGDNEGFEAEIFFKRGRNETGNIYMREGPCTDQVTLKLSVGLPGGTKD